MTQFATPTKEWGGGGGGKKPEETEFPPLFLKQMEKGYPGFSPGGEVEKLVEEN